MNQWNIYVDNTTNSDLGRQESFDFSFCPAKLERKMGGTLDAVLPTQGWPKAELSEINCTSSESVLQLLLPTLAKLTAQKRWISLISPPADINLTLFSYYGIDTSRVLLIHPKNDVDDKATMNKALKNGTSGVVIFWTTELNKRYLAQWRKSVKQGRSMGVIVNMSQKKAYSESIALSFQVDTEAQLLSVSDIRLFGVDQTQREKILFSKVDVNGVMERRLLLGDQKNTLN